MTLIDNQLSDLRAGYRRADLASGALKKQWREPLLKAYANRTARYNASLERRQQRVETVLQYGLGGAAGLLVFAFLLRLIYAVVGNSNAGLSRLPALSVWIFGLGLLAFITVPVLWLGARLFVKFAPRPENPLNSNLVPSLMPAWRNKLAGSLPPLDPNYYGGEGEYRFIGALQRQLPANYAVLYSLFQRHGEDIDVVLVGPKGVWVFEVKHWNHYIGWHNGQWQRQRTYHQAGGVPVTESIEVSQPLEAQWQRAAGDVHHTIQRRAGQLAGRFQNRLAVQGGIVFTHDDASLDIDTGFPVQWGRTGEWLAEIARTPEMEDWSEFTTMTILDVLLHRHHQITGDSPYSMRDHAEFLVQRAEDRIRNWINSSS